MKKPIANRSKSNSKKRDPRSASIAKRVRVNKDFEEEEEYEEEEDDYDNNNRGVLFVNKRKKTSKHPDYTGNAEVDGIEYWLAGWAGKSKGKKYMSLAFTPKEENENENSDRQNTDDLPF